jgi:hypothetical protein
MSHHPFPWQEAFLAALRAMPVVQHACDVVGIERCTAYRARQGDEAFAKAWEEAMEAGIDRAEQEAFRRGVVGFEEPVIDKGQLAYRYERYVDDEGKEAFRKVLDEHGQPVPLTVRKHSDAMLGLVLKARRKAYSTERTELTSPDGSMSPADEGTRTARVAQLLAAAKARREAENFDDLA